MFRGMFRAQLRAQAEGFGSALAAEAEAWRERLRGDGVVAFALYGCEGMLFAYVEATDDGYMFEWPDKLRESMEPWPGQPEPRYAVPMMDVFHDGVPRDFASWREGRHIDERRGSLARLKPEMYASYVFYHYQLQEEKPESFNKTYMIGATENYIFSYSESPAPVSGNKPAGLLRTSNTPDDWHSVMLPHFVPWEGLETDQSLWRAMETLFVL